MGKQIWKPGNMLYPVPVVLVSTADKNGKENIITVAWTGTICTNPAMLYISVRPERYSYAMLMDTKEFGVNLTTEPLAFATDFCGVRSGKEVNKFEQTHLTPIKGSKIGTPLIKESPVSIECKIRDMKTLGSHTMFIAEVMAVQVEDYFLDENGKFELSRAKPIVYSHGEYYSMGKCLGTFGYSVKKRKKARR